MKNKIWILALFGLFFGTKMHGQADPLSVTLQNVCCPGASVCVSINCTCPSCGCSTCGGGGGGSGLSGPPCCLSPAGPPPCGNYAVSFTSSSSCGYIYWGGSYPSGNGTGNTCINYSVKITSGASGPDCTGNPITDTYTLGYQYDPNTEQVDWCAVWSGTGNYYNGGPGVGHIPDITLVDNGGGTFLAAVPGVNLYDLQGNQMDW